MVYTDVMKHVAQGFEAFGVAVLVLGMAWSVIVASRTWRAAGGRRGYQALRETFGGVLLLGLEILVAADLIRTVAVSPTLQSVTVLALIVVIRTFLSFSLQIEIDGVPPWPTHDRSRRSSVSVVALRRTTDTWPRCSNTTYRIEASSSTPCWRNSPYRSWRVRPLRRSSTSSTLPSATNSRGGWSISLANSGRKRSRAVSRWARRTVIRVAAPAR